MQTATHTLCKSPKAKKIEDIVKPDATMRLHQRLFDRRRKHHIEVKEETSPSASLSAYLIDPKYRPQHDDSSQSEKSLVTTTPMPVLQYSQITRDMPEENYLEHEPSTTRSFMNRITQRYHVFVSQHKPFYYSLTNGTASGWLQNPRARVALAGSALALLLFFTGVPTPTPPTGPNNPAGQNPIVIQDISRGTPTDSTSQPENRAPNTPQAPASSPSTNSASGAQQPATPTNSAQDMSPLSIPTYGGGYGSGPAGSTTTSGSTPTAQTTTPSQPSTSTNLIQDIVKPTPVTIPGQDIQLDDKRILQTTDTTITIN